MIRCTLVTVLAVSYGILYSPFILLAFSRIDLITYRPYSVDLIITKVNYRLRERVVRVQHRSVSYPTKVAAGREADNRWSNRNTTAY